MHDLDHGGQDIRIRFGEDAVAQIKNVAGRPPGASQNVARRVEGHGGARQTTRRIEISLHRAVPDASTALVEIDVPVNADHVTARGRHEGEELTGAHSEQDRRHVEYYSKQDDGSWVLREYSGAESPFFIARLGVQISLGELYASALKLS